MKKLFLVLLILSFVSVTFAQNHRTCGTMSSLKSQQDQDPLLKSKMTQIELEAAKWIKKHGKDQQKGIITIPVVVHVIYKFNVQNISVAQIKSQIEILNQDYHKMNADTINTPNLFKGLAADIEIEFCFARQRPDGGWTNGITRTKTTKTVFDLYQNDAKYTAQGGYDAWDRDKYFNIWVVPSIKAGASSGILGYAQLPGGSAATDGVVVGYLYFGNIGTAQSPYDKGRTLTHETGHWLNLYHIWGDDGNACSGSDQVQDTPNQASENYGCPTFPSSSCSNTSDMFMNYMDYTNDACMNMFTLGQKQRMLAVMNTNRVALKTSTMCQTVSIDNVDLQERIKVYPNPSKGIFTIDFTDVIMDNNITISIYNIMGQLVYIEECAAVQSQKQIEIPNLTNGIYMLHINSAQTTIIKKIEIHR